MAQPIINPNVTLDFQTMTLADLRAEFRRLAGVLALAQDQRAEIAKVAEAKRLLAQAQVKLAELTEDEKDALRLALGMDL